MMGGGGVFEVASFRSFSHTRMHTHTLTPVCLSVLQLHVRSADETVRVGPAVAADSYLNMEAILAAIEDTGAQAVSTSVHLHSL